MTCGAKTQWSIVLKAIIKLVLEDRGKIVCDIDGLMHLSIILVINVNSNNDSDNNDDEYKNRIIVIW